jgi:hypothetical protein
MPTAPAMATATTKIQAKILSTRSPLLPATGRSDVAPGLFDCCDSYPEILAFPSA